VSPRSRALAFGSAGVVVLAGALCAVLVPGATGAVLTIALMSIGLVAVMVLAFLEVGLSEDRERARDEEHRRRRAEKGADARIRAPLRRRPRRPG
jgi:hypothetical protein